MLRCKRCTIACAQGGITITDAANSPLTVPAGAEWGPGFDAASATNAWVATIPAAERARSDDYFEGGYWIEAWGTLITVAIAWILLASRFSARLRDFGERHARKPAAQTLIYAALFLLALGILGLPWALYTGHYREHQYGMSNQTLAAFLGERAIVATAVFVFFVNLAYPLFIAPLYNDFRSLPEGPVRESILTLAHENGIPADDVYWFDASRQTRRISANVAGIAGTTRIALNDNLLNGTSLPEIRAVMAHEMGHYALHHALWLPLATVLLLGAGYWAVNRLFGTAHARFGARYGVRDIADPAGLPLAMAIFAVVMYLLTPLSNSIVRIAENQADAFGLDAAQEPQGFASVSMRLATYRKIEPGRAEECIFFDHPSGRTRVLRSMNWLAAHPPQDP